LKLKTSWQKSTVASNKLFENFTGLLVQVTPSLNRRYRHCWLRGTFVGTEEYQSNIITLRWWPDYTLSTDTAPLLCPSLWQRDNSMHWSISNV